MKLMIFSHHPAAPSGYANQVSGLAINLTKEGHEVSIVALNNMMPPTTYGDIKVFPTRPGITEVHQDLYYWAQKEKPDAILQLFDAWCIGKEWIIKDYIPVLTYNPIDCEGLPTNFIEGCRNSSMNIAMSPHAAKTFKQYNISPSVYIPHSIDTSYYSPMAKSEARKELDLPPGAFIFAIIGTNLTHRKNIPGQLLAFKKFLEITKARNCYMYIHAATYEVLVTSYNIPYIIDNLGLSGKVIVPNQNDYLLNSIPQHKMLALYNSIDVLMCCSLGEGFGIPILEAQACGKPVIGANFSAIPYTMGNGGIKIRKLEPFCDSGHMAWWAMPNVDEITNAMIEIYEDKKLRKELSTKALENAQNYDWKLWIPKWNEVLEEAV